MKKLNLNVASLGATEILSREELKNVLGGTATGTGSKPCDEKLRDSTGKELTSKPCDGKAEGDSCFFYRYNGYASGCPLVYHSGTCGYVMYSTCVAV